MRFIQLNINPLREVGEVSNLVLDWGVWWRLQPKPEQVAGLWLRWETADAELVEESSAVTKASKANNMLEAALALPNLRWLDLSAQRLRNVPERVFELKQLEVLDLSHNQLVQLPAQIIQLQKLTRLVLSNNPLQPLPQAVTQLPHLFQIERLANPFVSFPKPVLEHVNLEKIHYFSLRKVPSFNLEKLKKASHLTKLDLSNSQLKKLPDWIGDLLYLTELDIDDNQITQLSASLANLDDLRYLKVKRHWKDETNFLQTPPLEALDLDENGCADITKLRAYFRQVLDAGVDYLYEAKLLIVGEAGAGKTSLARRIVDAEAALPESEESTHGIDITRWEFPLGEKNFRVNIWDFGGQQIYHATHQFFLTKRSLYVLVADTRKDNTDFYDWLNRVELFSAKSPVFIVKNQKDERSVEIDEPALRARFGNLEKVFAANLSTNQAREAMLDFIRYRIQQLPHVGQALPKSWLQVRKALEADSRNSLDVKDYLELCQTHGFKRREDALQLSEYLHDLGVCLHFQQDDLLAKTVILQPEWATDAVYKLLDHELIKAQKGRFSRADAAQIWFEEEYAEMRSELLRLMTHFQLCYALPNNSEFVAPQVLPKQRPTYAWDVQDNLRLHYAYPGFMPKGIVSRFIVALHEWVEDGRQCAWRNGVVLSKDGARAEVVEDYEHRKILMRIQGSHKRDFLTQIVHELDKIHAGFHGLPHEKCLPCQCKPYVHEPEFFKYSDVRRFVELQKPLQCRRCGEMLDAQQLLNGVFNSGEKNMVAPRIQALNLLKNLSEAEFREVVFTYDAPKHYLPRRLSENSIFRKMRILTY